MLDINDPSKLHTFIRCHSRRTKHPWIQNGYSDSPVYARVESGNEETKIKLDRVRRERAVLRLEEENLP